MRLETGRRRLPAFISFSLFPGLFLSITPPPPQRIHKFFKPFSFYSKCRTYSRPCFYYSNGRFVYRVTSKVYLKKLITSSFFIGILWVRRWAELFIFLLLSSPNVFLFFLNAQSSITCCTAATTTHTQLVVDAFFFFPFSLPLFPHGWLYVLLLTSSSPSFPIFFRATPIRRVHVETQRRNYYVPDALVPLCILSVLRERRSSVRRVCVYTSSVTVTATQRDCANQREL